MKRLAVGLYGLGAYLVFLASFVYLMGFVHNFLVPKGIDHGDAHDAAWWIDLALVALFAVQHTIMARPAFKKRLFSRLPECLERSTFVWLASICLGLMMFYWQPIAGSLWTVQSMWGVWFLYGLSAFGFVLVLVSSFQIDHFELFGLRQLREYVFDKPRWRKPFFVPFLYRMVRHPMMTGTLIAFWATPNMTWSHLVLAAGFSGYLVAGMYFEERELVLTFGDSYRNYRKSTPALFPRLF